MSSGTRRLTRIGNRIAVWLYRTFDGRLSGGGKQGGVLMITAPGRRTGLPRSTCVAFLDGEDGLLVWGSGSGSRRDPDWFRNLRAADEVEVQVRARTFLARPQELLGAERDRAWHDVVLARRPQVERYARKSGRTVPVAVLRPVDDDGGVR